MMYLSWVALVVGPLATAVPSWLFLKLKKDVRELATKAATQEQVAENSALLAGRTALLEAKLEAMERNKEAQAQWVGQAESLNLNRRGQVLRLHRRGESAAEIASALRMGPGEVALMIKVYELGRQTPDMQEENF